MSKTAIEQFAKQISRLIFTDDFFYNFTNSVSCKAVKFNVPSVLIAVHVVYVSLFLSLLCSVAQPRLHRVLGSSISLVEILCPPTSNREGNGLHKYSAGMLGEQCP